MARPKPGSTRPATRPARASATRRTAAARPTSTKSARRASRHASKASGTRAAATLAKDRVPRANQAVPPAKPRRPATETAADPTTPRVAAAEAIARATGAPKAPPPASLDTALPVAVPPAAGAGNGSPRLAASPQRPRKRAPVLDTDDADADALVGRAVSSLDVEHHPRALRRAALLTDEELDGIDEAELLAGDLDASLQAATMIGEETPGGENPTPDQDVVDLIGRSLGVEYADDEELEGGAEIVRRDRQRWELDPASSEDWKIRNR